MLRAYLGIAGGARPLPTRELCAAEAAGKGATVRKRNEIVIHAEVPLNAEPPPRALRGARPPLDAFYVRSHGPAPEIDPAALRLRVDGLVDRALELSLDELREDFPEREVEAMLQCAGNRRTDLMAVREIPGELPWGPAAIGTARWRGVALADVLAAAGVRPGARHVAFLGLDEVEGTRRFGGSVPLPKALQPEAAEYRLEPPGFPLGEVAVNAGITAPDEGELVPAGPVAVQGWAVTAGPRTIERVDVSGDGGRDWIQAELLEDQGPWAWRRWSGEVELAPGDAEIVVRAWDSAASSQPDDPAALWNAKGYANNACPRLRLQG